MKKNKKCINQIQLQLWIFGLLFFGSQIMASAKPPVIVINPSYRLLLDTNKGTIESFRITGGSDHELLIPNHGRLPLFKIEFLDADSKKFRTITSADAKKVSVTKTAKTGGEMIVLNYEGISDLGIAASVTLWCPYNESLTYWNLEVDNPTALWIGHIQFPVVEVSFDKNPNEGDSSFILTSIFDGVLTGPVTPNMSTNAWRGTDHDTPELWRSVNYPQIYTTQLMAYYNEKGGLYLACNDSKGLPKLLIPIVENDGVTMGLGHYPGTRGPGKTRLSYDVVLGSFRGDWHAAAEIYRNWAIKQPFCARKLSQRTDCPKWLAEPLVGVAFPMRGQGDWDPPAALNPEYAPATHALPYLDKLATALDCPLMPIVFNWEHAGPWVQPEAFPPVGGEVDMRAFMAAAKSKGWHPVLYGDGMSWVVGQKNTGYDGMEYFKSHGGDAAVSYGSDGKPFFSEWPWRKQYGTCVATEAARNMVLGMTQGMAELGPDVIQQFDQGIGVSICYATNHGHAPIPGPWMTDEFNNLIKQDNKMARSINHTVITSCEGAPPEVYLQDLGIWDARWGGWIGKSLNCPLFSFIYHEYLYAHSGFYTSSVNDADLRASVARAFVYGYILNFTLREKGLIAYDWDKVWDPLTIPDQNVILDWAKRVTHFRTGVGRDYLVFGKMLMPWNVTNVETQVGYGKEPFVESATWQAQDGNIGVVLANYTDAKTSPRVELEGHGKKKVVIHVDDKSYSLEVSLPYVIDIELPPRSLGLIEVEK